MNQTKQCFLGLLLVVVSSLGYSQGLKGKVTDKVTGEPLAGANLLLLGTAMGSATDMEGYYHIKNVSPGNYILRVSYLGYKSDTVNVDIYSDRVTNLDVSLAYDVLEGQEVTITAQAEGQVAAINQQLSSNTIKNVVSSERIMELPDANAAESVGRLPGVSIKRSGGEGNRVVIRGLSPAYNSITIGGEKIPATDLDNRAVDLNMISPEILDGIEVTKALTPDMDADAFGGTVNFKLATAPSEFRTKLRFQQGYNQLRNEFGQYKGSITISNRYFEDKLGIMITGNLEQAQRGSDQFNTDYNLIREKRDGEDFAPVSANKVMFEYGEEIRRRFGFSLLMDYKLGDGKIMFSNFMSRLDRQEDIVRNEYSAGNNHTLNFRDRQRQIDILTNSFSGEHDFGIGNIDWRLSRTASLTRYLFDNQFSFQERSAVDQGLIPDQATPEDILNAAYNNLDAMYLQRGTSSPQKSFERDYSAQFNMEIPFTLISNIAGFMKFGGKYINKYKYRDKDRIFSRLDFNIEQLETYHSQADNPDFEYQRSNEGLSLFSNYMTSDFDYGNFLNGDYNFWHDLNRSPGVNDSELNHLLETFLLDSYYTYSSLADLDDYDLVEEVSSAYVMTEINFGRTIMLMPGVRYENTVATMTGRKGTIGAEKEEPPSVDDPFVTDTSAVAEYGEWFPMVHLRIRPTEWFDIRLAYTESISRPRLDWMLPKKKVRGVDLSVEFGRPDLKPQLSTNYDVFLSFYTNEVGLFTLGFFYKEIKNLIYMRNDHLILDAEEEGYPADLDGFALTQPENNPFDTEVKGFEIEWQTHLNWLPFPFDGIVMNVNYSHIWSETQFPRSFVRSEDAPPPIFRKTTVIDTFRVGNMPDQADDIVNISVGYERGPFMMRFAMLYQGNTLNSVGTRPELDGFISDLLRMDLSVKYELTPQIGLFFNYNNITNEPDQSYQQGERFLTESEYYGWTADIGIGYEF